MSKPVTCTYGRNVAETKHNHLNITTMADLRVWCLLINHEKKGLPGDVFSVRVPPDAYVEDLTEKVMEKRSDVLKHIAPAMLTVWRCTNPKLLATVNREQLEKDLRNIDFSDETKAIGLGGGRKITTLDLSDGETLLIEVPAALSEQMRSPSQDSEPEHDIQKVATNVGMAQLIAEIERFLKATGTDLSAFVAALQSTGTTAIPAKRPRLSDESLSEVSRDSAIWRLDNHETKLEHRLAYLLYEGLWKKGNFADLIVERTHHVPNLEHSISDEQTKDAQHSDLVARFVDLTKLEGWSEELSTLLTTRFLIREEYDELDSFLASVHERGLSRVLLIGQPGIGKRVYLTYCLLKRLSSGKRTIFSWSEKRRYLFQENGAFCIPYTTIGAAGLTITDDDDSDALILYDLNNDQPRPYQMRNWHIVVASSPKESRWKHWEKETQPETFIMKTWGWEEMYISRGLAVTNRNDDEWRVAFLKYGGSARHLLAMEETTLSFKTTQAIRQADAKDLFRPMNVEFKDNVSSFLVEINPMTDPQSMQCDRRFRSGGIISKAILELIIERTEIEIASAMKRSFETLMWDNWQGNRPYAGLLFEGAGHRWLLKACKSPLTANSLSHPGQTVVLNLSHLVKTLDFGRIKEIDGTKYYRPLSSRLEGVDSFALEVDTEGHATEVILFQFTVSAHHPIKISFVEELWGFGNLSNLKWRYIFIVPEDEASGLTEQPWAPASEADTWKKRIDQYVLGVNTVELFASLRK